ncbi:Succinylglutamate desuccinylase [Candidatus Enterovibrio altilux]|uniref:Succinylglutamate desuccinylase n=1 Tax=Candidatus Enterovibrio altilux TaxID=1927128 RepID=A0A291B6Z4_9GAMM|nr:Succinylglutamate desuccinylase [Candidatus Enterovibrio luxaltus]
MSGGFLHHTLYSPTNFQPQHFVLNNGVGIKHHDVGVVEIVSPNSQINVVISSGIHGDETAPIILIDELVTDIFNQKFVPMHRILFIIAYPAAIHAHTRFIEENLNQLFAGKNDDRNAECALANRLQRHVSTFFASTSANSFSQDKTNRWHFDLHSTIRNSKHYMFAVIPASTHAIDIRPLTVFLSAAGIDAILLSRTPSSTFSWWTCENFGALAATFEMGCVTLFHQNNMEAFKPLKQAMKSLLSSDAVLQRKSSYALKAYKVSRTITKMDESFRLAFDKQVANFTFFIEGELLAQENNIFYTAGLGGEAVVFPNAKVTIGQRACLLVQPFKPNFSQPLYVNVELNPELLNSS